MTNVTHTLGHGLGRPGRVTWITPDLGHPHCGIFNLAALGNPFPSVHMKLLWVFLYSAMVGVPHRPLLPSIPTAAPQERRPGGAPGPSPSPWKSCCVFGVRKCDSSIFQGGVSDLWVNLFLCLVRKRPPCLSNVLRTPLETPVLFLNTRTTHTLFLEC